MRLMMFAIHSYILLSLCFIDSLVHYAEKLKPDCISTYALSLISPVHFLNIVLENLFYDYEASAVESHCFQS